MCCTKWAENLYLLVWVPWLPSLLVFPQVLQVHEGPVQREKKGNSNKILLEKGNNLAFINGICRVILTLFPGGPEGPDSPVGPGEPWSQFYIDSSHLIVLQFSLRMEQLITAVPLTGWPASPSSPLSPAGPSNPYKKDKKRSILCWITSKQTLKGMGSCH